MKQILFPIEEYKVRKYKDFDGADKTDLEAVNDERCGIYEMIWTMITTVSQLKLEGKDHKTNKKLKAKLKEISRFKDEHEISRISKLGDMPHVVLLEDAEFELLKRMVDDSVPRVVGRYSETICAVLELMDSAVEVKALAAVKE